MLHTRLRVLAVAPLMAAAAALLAAQPALTQPPAEADPDSVAEAGVAEDRVVVTGMVPAPRVGEGAPIYTTLELEKMEADARRETTKDRAESRRCQAADVPNPHADLTLEGRFFLEAQLGQRVVTLTDRATTVTRAAEAARRAAANGSGTMEAVVSTELERQVAVRKLEAARRELLEEQSVTADLMWLMSRGLADIDLQSELMRRRVKREKAGGVSGVRPAPEFADLKVVGVVVEQKTDRKGVTTLHVSGQIVNTRDKDIPIPPLTIMAVDEQGWPLMNRIADPQSRQRIPAGAAMGFTYELKPKPAMARTVAVTFASKSKSTMQLPAGLFEVCRVSKESNRR